MKTRILFVDDEPKVLQGLKRMLHSMRSEWDMTFAISAQEALNVLSQQPYDVIVSDMRMPGVDGAQLLTEVKRCYPRMVRLILSGESAEQCILRSVGPSHQFLSKPCDPEMLKETIVRARTLSTLLDEGPVKELVAQITSVPSLPTLYIELLELLKSPDATIKEAGAIIEKDIAMTAKILQLVNSAYFGIPRKVSSVVQAVSFLGLETVKTLVLSVEVFSQFDLSKLPNFSVDGLWRHSVGTATYARKIAQAENLDRKVTDTAFMVGMLHDVGKLVLAANLPEQFGRTIDLANDRGISHAQAERDVYGTTHAEVGAYLLGLWGFPILVAESVAYHHLPQVVRSTEGGTSPAAYTADETVMVNAIRAANIFEHQDHPTAIIGALEPIEEQYLATCGMADRFPVWREKCVSPTEKEQLNDVVA